MKNECRSFQVYTGMCELSTINHLILLPKQTYLAVVKKIWQHGPPAVHMGAQNRGTYRTHALVAQLLLTTPKLARAQSPTLHGQLLTALKQDQIHSEIGKHLSTSTQNITIHSTFRSKGLQQINRSTMILFGKNFIIKKIITR